LNWDVLQYSEKWKNYEKKAAFLEFPDEAALSLFIQEAIDTK